MPELVPIRYGRMLVSPFTFYRGAAMIMAADLAASPRTGCVQLCGDAHLSNFGVFASPERRLVFDINDFDERSGPWEWDVKRLAASMLIAAHGDAFRPKDQERVVLDTVGRYRTAMASFAGRGTSTSGTPTWTPRVALREFRCQFKPKVIERGRRRWRRLAPRTA